MTNVGHGARQGDGSLLEARDICPACGKPLGDAHVIRESETGQGWHFLCWERSEDDHADA
jgi:hypothetical protein